MLNFGRVSMFFFERPGSEIRLQRFIVKDLDLGSSNFCSKIFCHFLSNILL